MVSLSSMRVRLQKKKEKKKKSFRNGDYCCHLKYSSGRMGGKFYLRTLWKSFFWTKGKSEGYLKDVMSLNFYSFFIDKGKSGFVFNNCSSSLLKSYKDLTVLFYIL